MVAPAPVRVGGILDIRVAGEPGLSKSYIVDAAGHITLDMVGQIMAAGQTPDQIAAELRTRLKQYVKEPTVTVAVITPLRQDVLVTGEVLRPNPVQLRPHQHGRPHAQRPDAGGPIRADRDRPRPGDGG